MKAAHYLGKRSFSIDTVEPIVPGPGEVRLNVAYCGICGTDLHIYHGAMDQRINTPQVIGHEASAVVAEVGESVNGFETGDHVVVRPLDNRGETTADRGLSHICKNLKFIGIDSPGAFQESWTVPAFTLHKIPHGIDLKIAALTEPLAVACHDVRMGNLTKGELAVVIGGGPIGLLVALVAKQTGARVVLSELSKFRLEFARSLGLEAVNPLETDIAELCRTQSDGAGADIVFEVSGAKQAALAMTELLAPRGRIVVVAIYPKPVEINLFQVFWKELTIHGARVYEPQDYTKAIDLIANASMPLENLITNIEPLDRLQDAFESADTASESIKTLIACNPLEV